MPGMFENSGLLDPDLIGGEIAEAWGAELAFKLDIITGKIPSDKFPLEKAVLSEWQCLLSGIRRYDQEGSLNPEESLAQVENSFNLIPVMVSAFATAVAQQIVRNNERLIEYFRAHHSA